MESLIVTRVGILTTVSISYNVRNPTQDLKEENGWMLFIQGVEGAYFGIQGPLPPGQSINRSFIFNVTAPEVRQVFAYPSNISDEDWDADDLIWIIDP